jgi:hypothetical protein
MTDRTVMRLARALFALVTVMLLGGTAAMIALTVAGHWQWHPLITGMGFTLAMYAFPVVGILIARRQPRNPLVWILLGVGVSWVIDFPLQAFFVLTRLDGTASMADGYVQAVNASLWVVGVVPLGTFLLLLFPDGHLPTPRWRWWGWFCGIAMALAMLAVTFSPGPIEGVVPPTDNPLGIDVLARVGLIAFAPVLLLPICIIGCAAALVGRYRRSAGVERLQLKWLAAAAATVATIYLVAIIVSIPYDWSTMSDAPVWVGVVQNVAVGSFMLIPLAVGIAILRYRLYDFDRLVNRALVYGAVSAALVAVYALGVVGVGTALRTITGSEQGNLAVAGSTLAVAALFGPVRARFQRFIDRRFYRRKYNAALTVEAFSVRLRQETDLSALSDELRDVVAQTVQPTSVAIWIAVRS